jgi:ATP-dependent Clp protease ATP-binding subunit ClpA
MTSNVGSQYLKAMSNLGFTENAVEGAVKSQEESYRGKVMESLRESFRPEFLNRIDEVVIFNPLRRVDIEHIVDLQVDQIQDRLNEHRIKIFIDPAAKKYLAKEGFDPEYGARPLKRLMQKAILDALADKIIRGELKDGGKVKVNFRANSLVFSV